VSGRGGGRLRHGFWWLSSRAGACTWLLRPGGAAYTRRQPGPGANSLVRSEEAGPSVTHSMQASSQLAPKPHEQVAVPIYPALYPRQSAAERVSVGIRRARPPRSVPPPAPAARPRQVRVRDFFPSGTEAVVVETGMGGRSIGRLIMPAGKGARGRGRDRLCNSAAGGRAAGDVDGGHGYLVGQCH